MKVQVTFTCSYYQFVIHVFVLFSCNSFRWLKKIKTTKEVNSVVTHEFLQTPQESH